jgi:hypothetical protein
MGPECEPAKPWPGYILEAIAHECPSETILNARQRDGDLNAAGCLVKEEPGVCLDFTVLQSHLERELSRIFVPEPLLKGDSSVPVTRRAYSSADTTVGFNRDKLKGRAIIMAIYNEIPYRIIR